MSIIDRNCFNPDTLKISEGQYRHNDRFRRIHMMIQTAVGAAPVQNPELAQRKKRVAAIDAFRGFTILAMIFVIQVAGYSDLPLTGSWFGSAPVSHFHHAAEAEGAGGIGCTFTDLIAPFFVFIVGMCIPLSKRRRGADWWKHVMSRTVMLILLGMLYISLILKLSWWWGVLQAIGIAYFMGAVAILLPRWTRWIMVFVICAFHAYMSRHVHWWLHIGDPTRPAWTIINPAGDMLRPLMVHCTPWASISYGAITIVGTILGESITSRSTKNIINQSILVGIVFTIIGYVVHRYKWPEFAINKETVTASYALFTSGISAFTFLLFYLIMDVANIKGWAWPFMVFGSNALLGYFMQPVVRIFIFALGFQPYLSNHSGWVGMYYGLMWTALLWVVVYWCNKKNIYWKI